jgi:heat shock transcription factor
MLVTVAAAAPPLRIETPTDSGEEQVISSNSSPATTLSLEPCSSTSELICENKRLKKENLQLSKELAQMKILCNNIYSLMSNYAVNQTDENNPEAGPGVTPLDLMPSGKEVCCDREERQKSPRLFGVAIGLKRSREAEDDDEKGDVKSEPLDDDDNEKKHWLRQSQRTS